MNVKEYKITFPGYEYSSEKKPPQDMNVKEYKTTSLGCEYSSERLKGNMQLFICSARRFFQSASEKETFKWHS